MQEPLCVFEIKILPHPKNYNSTIFPLRLVNTYLFKKEYSHFWLSYLLWHNVTIGTQASGESGQGTTCHLPPPTPHPPKKKKMNDFRQKKWLSSGQNKSSHEFCLYITYSSRRLFLFFITIYFGRDIYQGRFFSIAKDKRNTTKGHFTYWLMFIYNCLTSCFKSIPVNCIY